VKRLDLVVGSNGAGKTTFINEHLRPSLPYGVPYVNADEIAKQRWPENPSAHAYDAAQIAANTRLQLISRGLPFIAETVFSHPSKLDLIALARAEGYHVIVRVLLVPEELTVARVASRVRAGGHSVPEKKIRERYQRVWPLAAQAIAITDRAVVYDNSRPAGPVIVAEFTYGLPTGVLSWPDWTPAPLRAVAP
jgi:predicted ABC-type ATPase